jgi:hypothetical protein
MPGETPEMLDMTSPAICPAMKLAKKNSMRGFL